MITRLTAGCSRAFDVDAASGRVPDIAALRCVGLAILPVAVLIWRVHHLQVQRERAVRDYAVHLGRLVRDHHPVARRFVRVQVPEAIRPFLLELAVGALELGRDTLVVERLLLA